MNHFRIRRPIKLKKTPPSAPARKEMGMIQRLLIAKISKKEVKEESASAEEPAAAEEANTDPKEDNE